MNREPDPAHIQSVTVPGFPSWARIRGASSSEVEIGYLAGASIFSLDQIVRSEPIWGGVWRHRLALKCAAAAAEMQGRRESEPDLRDGFLFTTPGDDPGPAGHVFLAWRKMVSRRPNLSRELLTSVLAHLDIGWTAPLSSAFDNVEEILLSSRPAPVVAAEVASEVFRAAPGLEVLSVWAADIALAAKLRWPTAVPLLAGEFLGPHFRRPGDRRRIRPGDPDWGRAVVLAYGSAAQGAHDMALELSERAEKMLALVPSLRAKGAGQVIRLLLDDDAVSASWSGPKISSRGARRLFDRLSQAGVVRELSGRSAFKIYGL